MLWYSKNGIEMFIVIPPLIRALQGWFVIDDITRYNFIVMFLNQEETYVGVYESGGVNSAFHIFS